MKNDATQTLRAGKRVVVAESEVYSLEDGGEILVAKYTSTLSVIPSASGDMSEETSEIEEVEQ